MDKEITTTDCTTPTKKLIDLIIQQRFDLCEYKDKLPVLLKEKFTVIIRKFPKFNIKGHHTLVDDIIEWENGKQTSSLEKMINENYVIKMLSKK